MSERAVGSDLTVPGGAGSCGPVGRDAGELWRCLVEDGEIDRLYRDGDPAGAVLPSVMHALFRRLDALESVGATLGVCIQASASLPLLATAAGRAGRPGHPLGRVLDDVRGGAMLGLAATDVTAGSDLVALQTSIIIEGGRCHLSGRKCWVTNALFASHLLVLARSGNGVEFTNFTWLLVPTDAPGVVVEPVSSALFAGAGTGHVIFEDVVLPAEHLVGAPGRGLIDFLRHISVERLAGGIWAQAICQRVLRETVEHLRHRQGQAGTLWDKEGIRRSVGGCLVATAQLSSLIAANETRIAEHRDHLAAALVKASAARVVDEVLATASHLQGARAFEDGGLQTLRAQTGLWGIGGGTYEVMLGMVGDHADRLLGRQV